MYICTDVYIHMYVFMCVCVCACLFVFMFVESFHPIQEIDDIFTYFQMALMCIRSRSHVRVSEVLTRVVQLYIYTHTYIYIYIYIYIYTHYIEFTSRKPVMK